MKKAIYLFFTLAFPLFLAAQEKTITGKVTDSQDGTPLVGVTVQVVTTDGQGAATTTNSSGSYSINAPSNAVQLFFSYTGMVNVTEVIKGRTTINVSMAKTDNTLNDVVVVGYGIQRRKNLTGAVTTVAAKDLVKNSNNDVTNTLTGR